MLSKPQQNCCCIHHQMPKVRVSKDLSPKFSCSEGRTMSNKEQPLAEKEDKEKKEVVEEDAELVQ